MRHLLGDIPSYLNRGALVFPSEIAAEFWRRAALTGDAAAVREDDFLSWDTFKEKAFEFHSDAVPVNRTLRTVFAEAFVRENAGQRMLSELIPPAFAPDASGFVPSIVSMLPRIPSALTILRGRTTGRLGRVRHDLVSLQQTYSSFLDAHRLFEPRWLQASRHFRGGQYLLVAPELADDFPEFRSTVESLPIYNPTPDASLSLRVYPDARTEIRTVFGEISALLDSGLDPADIYVSVAGLEMLTDRIRHEAERANLPVVLRAGHPLSDSAIGRFIRSIGEVVDAGFGVAALERFLLNAAVPWRDSSSPSRLVILGVENGALGGLPGVDQRWQRVSRRGGDGTGSEHGGGEARLLKSLKRLLPAVCRAPTFDELRRRFNELLGTLVDRDGWQPDDERVLERSQEELRALSEIELTTGLTVDNPYQFWLGRLAENQYVRQSVTTGIAVLPYRVGAAICPKHHFVINATHRETRAMVRSFPFLGDAERGELEQELSDRDLSRDFLETYTASGLEVKISASRVTHSGSALPAGYFVSSGRVREEPAPVHSAADATPLEAEGRREYARGARRSAADFTMRAIEETDVRRLVLDRLTVEGEATPLRISPTHVDRFRNCPFDYLLEYGVGLRELTLAIDPENPARLGMLYHEIFAEFFDELAASGRRFESSQLAELRERLSVIADAHHQKAKGMIPDIVYQARRELFRRVANAVLANDATLIDGHEPLLAEEWQHDERAAGNFVLVGRVDRVTRAPDGRVVLVDYKRSGTPKIRELNGGSAGPTEEMTEEQKNLLGSLQIPLYVRLLENAGMTVAGAGYYGLDYGRYLCVFDEREQAESKPAMSRARADQIMQVVDEFVSTMADRVRRGEFTCGDACANCNLAAVCRSRFHVG